MDPYRASRAERSSALLKSLGDRAFWNACAVRRFKSSPPPMEGFQMLKDFRCGRCKRLLARMGENTELQIKCSRCGTLNHVKAVEPRVSRHGATTSATYAVPSKLSTQ